MSTTPRTDRAWVNYGNMLDFARQLETELDAANARIAELEAELDNEKKKIAHQNGTIVMAGLKVAELEDEITRLREYCRPCDVSAADAEIGYNHVDYGYAFELSHDGTMVLKTIGSGNERAK